MKKSTIFANLTFAAAFIAFLVFMGVQSYRLPKESVSLYENRTLAEVPEVTAASLGDGAYFTDLETALCDGSAYRTAFLRLRTALDLALGRPVVNTVVPTEDGVALPYQEYRPVDSQKIHQKAELITDGLAALQQQIEAYGGKFLYVAIPDQSSYFAERYPAYLNDRSETYAAETEAFFTAAAEKGVGVLKVAERWAAEGNPEDYMSKIDHHFTFKGGHSVYQMILEELDGVAEEVAFTVQEADAPYLGSRTLRLCDLWGAKEAFCYGVPAEEIPFTRYDWGNTTAAPSTVITFPEEGTAIQYGAYMGGDISQTILETHRPELADCLIMGDSFTNLLEGLLYTGFDETRSLDYRYYDEMPLSQYVAEYQPEVVLLVRDTANLLNETGNGNVQ